VTEPQKAIESASSEITRLRGLLVKGASKQVSSDDERSVIKATALSWFNTHRKVIASVLDPVFLSGIDDGYRIVLGSSDKAALRSRYIYFLKQVKKALARVQSDHVLVLSTDQHAKVETSEVSPGFAPLVTDTRMQTILGNRWQECVKCVSHGAPLSAVVMMGGILEGLLLARINQMKDKSKVFKAAAAPKDKAGITLPLKEWGLTNYLDVAHELEWISRTTRDVGGVVRDYRNYVHPQKEYSHGVIISIDDAKMLWEISKSVARQVLKP
jgi:hypothetical protein